MEQYKAYALKGTILALLGMFSVQLISPLISKYFTWAGTFGAQYLLPFIILFATLLGASFIIKQVWNV